MARYRYVDKLPEPPSPPLERGSEIHKVVAQYLRGDLPADDPIPGWTHFAKLFRQLRELDPAIEVEWGFTNKWKPTGWFGSDTWFRSVIDALVLYDTDADVVDHKTGRPRPQETAEQAELYAVSVFVRHPNVQRVSVRFWYLDADVKVAPGQRETVYRFERSAAKEIVARWNKRAKRMLSDKIMAPTPGQHCRYCAFSASAGGPCRYG